MGWVAKFFLASLCLVACAKPTLPPVKAPARTVEPAFDSETKRHFHNFARPEGKPSLDVKSYALEASFDWDHLTLKAKLTISLQLLDDKNSVTLDSRVTRMVTVQDASGNSLVFKADAETGKLVITLPAELAAAARATPVSLVLTYEAKSNVLSEAALAATPVRKGDPVKSRVVATFSEPQGAQEWMPCHDTPADRALFSARFTMPENERLIANGEKKEETVTAGVRQMAYATSYSLPTYLMAFAVGNFEVTTDNSRRVPLQIWHRTGLTVDSKGMLEFLGNTLDRFENLLVPYPFEKYALVLLPAFRGGLEHASITFQGETRSSQARVLHDLELSAHELAHQWFGDLMTIATWDDLWIKEGMATLLAQEATRGFQDGTKSQRLFGRDFNVDDGQAIRDLSLKPNDMYTSGPYGRAAWAYSQIRAHLGEKRFWSWLTNLLEDNAYKSLSTKKFLEALSREAGPAFTAKFEAALAAKALPSVEKIDVKDQSLSFTFKDEDSALFTPLEFHTLAVDGSKTQYTVTPGQHTLAIPNDSVLILDPAEIHPVMEFGFEKAGEAITPLLVGKPATHLKLFPQLSAANQIDALYSRAGWTLTPDTFQTLYRATHSESGKYRMVAMACDVAQSADFPEWKTALLNVLRQPPTRGIPDPASGDGWSACRPILTDKAFSAQWKEILDTPERSGEREPELLQLGLISLDQGSVFSAVKLLTSQGGTTRTQRMMLELMGLHFEKHGMFQPPADAETWKDWLRGFVQTSEVDENLSVALGLLTRAKDEKSLDPFARAINQTARLEVKYRFYCAAYTITKGKTEQWNRFTGQLNKAAELSTQRCSK